MGYICTSMPPRLDPYPLATCNYQARRAGFTLIEVLVVITVILAIMGMTIPAVSAVRASQARSATEALVTTISSAMTQYGTDGILVPTATGGDGPMRPLWDFNSDGICDGDPRKDDAFSATDRAAADRAGYRGPMVMLGLSLSTRQYDAQGRIVDPWRMPLRISRYPSGSGRLQVWSLGKDKVVDTTDDGDDIKPWRTTRAR